MARGSLSSRRQSSAIVARRLRLRPFAEEGHGVGSASAGTGYSTSPWMRNSSRLVTSSVRLGQRDRSVESSGAASTTCSMLSRSRSISRSPMCSARPSLAPTVSDIAWSTSAGSRTAASPTQKTPALYSGTSVAAASMASRVFPEPPGPVSVTSLAPPWTLSSTAARSRCRPMKELAGRGRFVFEIVLSGGNRSSPSWKIATGSSMSFSRCSPSAMSATARRLLASQARRTRPARHGRRPQCERRDGRRVRRSPRRSEGSACCRPMRTRIGPSSSLVAPGGRGCVRRGRESEEEGVSLGVHLDPAWLAQTSRIRRGVGQRPGVLLGAEALQELRGAFHVREQEGERAGWQVARARFAIIRPNRARDSNRP